MNFPQEYENKNDEKDDDAKVYTIGNDGNESYSEDEIMLEDEDADRAVIDRESANRKTTTRSGIVLIPPEILKDYETGDAILDRYKQAVTLTPSKEKFYLQMK